MEKNRLNQVCQSVLISLASLTSLLLFNPGSISAANPELVLTPPFTEVVLDNQSPEASFDIQIENRGNSYETFAVSVVDFGSLDQTGGVAFIGTQSTDNQIKYGLASWVVVDKNYLQVAPGAVDKIKITIVNKESLSPGGHYAAVLLSSDATVGGLGNISFNYAFSSLIFAKKMGGEIANLELKQIVPPLSSWLIVPSKLALNFQNTGNIHLVPRGEIDISDSAGRQVGRGIINAESGLILPESFREYSTPIRSISWPFFPGNYKITIDYRFDGREETARQTLDFFFLGLPFIVTLFVSILGPIIIYQLRRNFVGRSHAKK